MKVKLSSKASRQLKKLKKQPVLARRLRTALLLIADDPYQGTLLDGVYKGLRSWRNGKWRILYRIHKKQLIVLIIEISDRKEAYR